MWPVGHRMAMSGICLFNNVRHTTYGSYVGNSSHCFKALSTQQAGSLCWEILVANHFLLYFSAEAFYHPGLGHFAFSHLESLWSRKDLDVLCSCFQTTFPFWPSSLELVCYWISIWALKPVPNIWARGPCVCNFSKSLSSSVNGTYLPHWGCWKFTCNIVHFLTAISSQNRCQETVHYRAIITVFLTYYLPLLCWWNVCY